MQRAEAARHSSIAVNLSDAIIKRYQPTIDALSHHGWDHSNSVVLHAMEKVYQRTKNTNYLNYIKAYANDHISPDGRITGLLNTLDGLHPGVLCLFLYGETGDTKYLRAATHMRNHFLGGKGKPSAFNKTPDGGYWHKNNEKYRNVLSVDGLYMAYPFLVHYAKIIQDETLLDIAATQIQRVAERSFNIKYNLPYHAWHYDKTNAWANPITGTSSQFWSRASGWFAMALVDVLEHFPKTHPRYKDILFLYQSLASGLKNAQNPKDGFWYHVLDAYEEPGNYPEVSGSGMIIYSLQKAVRLNLLHKSYADTAAKGWLAIQTKIKNYSDGGPQITSFAPGMSSQNTYQDYIAIRPVTVPTKGVKQYAHGYMGVLMAASEMERLN